MNDRPVMSPGGVEPGWETRLQQTARAFNYPPTPDIAGRVRQRLAGESRPARWALAWAALVALVILAGLLAVPQVRAAVAEWLQIGSVRIFLAEPTTTPTPTAQPTTTPRPTARPTVMPTPSPTLLTSVLDLDGETSLARVRTRVDFPVRLPTYPAELGPPDRVFLQDLAGPMVVLAWLDPDRPGQVRLSLHVLGPETFAGKTTPAVIQETEVHGRPAVWAEGPHSFILENGEYAERRLVEGNVLIWTEERLTYRLETELPLEEAVRIAESLE